MAKIGQGWAGRVSLVRPTRHLVSLSVSRKPDLPYSQSAFLPNLLGEAMAQAVEAVDDVGMIGGAVGHLGDVVAEIDEEPVVVGGEGRPFCRCRGD